MYSASSPGAEVDVVLPISVRQRDAAVRVRQGRPSLVLGPEAGLGEDRAAFARASSERGTVLERGPRSSRPWRRPRWALRRGGPQRQEAVADAPSRAPVEPTAGPPGRSGEQEQRGRGQKGGRRAEHDRWVGVGLHDGRGGCRESRRGGRGRHGRRVGVGHLSGVRVTGHGKVGHGPQTAAAPAAGRRRRPGRRGSRPCPRAAAPTWRRRPAGAPSPVPCHRRGRAA